MEDFCGETGGEKPGTVSRPGRGTPCGVRGGANRVSSEGFGTTEGTSTDIFSRPSICDPRGSSELGARRLVRVETLPKKDDGSLVI